MSGKPEQPRNPVAPLKRVEHWIKARVFRLLRLFFRRGRLDHPPLDTARIQKVLFLRPESKLGDLVISLAAVDLLRRQFPHITASIWCSPANAVLIADDPRFERVHLYRKRIWRDLRELRRVRAQAYDCVADLVCDDSVTALALSQWAAPGAPRLGMGKIRFAPFYDFDSQTPFDPSEHIIINTARVLAPLGVTISDSVGFAPPFLTDDRKRRAHRFIDEVTAGQPKTRLIGLNLCSGHPSRDWGNSKSEDLARRLLHDVPDLQVIAIVTPKERERGRQLCRVDAAHIHLVEDGLDILSVAAVISHLALLISPDTALVHIARALQVPVVSMHPARQRNLALWRPYRQQYGAVQSRSDTDIHDITVEQVFAETQRMITSLDR